MSDLIGTIYDAASNPACWQTALDELVPLCGGKIALTLHDQKSGLPAFLVTANWEEDWATSYTNYYSPINPWTANLQKIRVGQVAHDEVMVPKRTLGKTEFFADWLRPQRLTSATAAVVFNDEQRFFNLSVMHESERFKDDCIRIFRTLMPHLQRSAQLTRQFSAIQAERDVGLEALDQSDTAVLVIFYDGRIGFTNQAALALLSKGEALTVVNGKLHTSSRPAEKLLHLIREACRRPISHSSNAGGTVSLPRNSKRPLSALVSPFRSDNPAALVFIRDLDISKPMPASALRSLFDLTSAEANLVVRIVDGASLKTIAENHNVSLHTLRTQLKSVMAKTGANRQGELIALIMRNITHLQSSEGT